MDVLKTDIRKLFFHFLIPSVGGAIAVAAYSFVDTIAIGQGVGSLGAAACAIVLPVFCIAQLLAFVCGVGGSVLMSAARGEGRKEKGDAYYTSALILTLFTTLAFWLFLVIFQKPFYRFFGADDTLLSCTLEYGNWIVWFFPFFVVVSVLGCFIRCDGAPKLVLYATLIGGCINIFGDWFLVFPLKMGMQGAAIATVSGTVVQVLILTAYWFSSRCHLQLKLPYQIKKAFRKIIGNGFGAGISSLSVIAVSLIANNQIMKYENEDALAVYGMLITIGSLFMGVYTGVGQAVQPIASPNFGAGNQKRYWKVCRFGMITVSLLGISFFLICELLPLQVTALFIRMTPGVEAIASFIVRIYGASFLPLSINIFVIMYLQCIMESKMASAISLLRGLFLNCVLLYLLPFFIQGKGIWLAVSIAEYAVCLLSLCYMWNLYRKYQRNISSK